MRFRGSGPGNPLMIISEVNQSSLKWKVITNSYFDLDSKRKSSGNNLLIKANRSLKSQNFTVSSTWIQHPSLKILNYKHKSDKNRLQNTFQIEHIFYSKTFWFGESQSFFFFSLKANLFQGKYLKFKDSVTLFCSTKNENKFMWKIL